MRLPHLQTTADALVGKILRLSNWPRAESSVLEENLAALDMRG